MITPEQRKNLEEIADRLEVEASIYATTHKDSFLYGAEAYARLLSFQKESTPKTGHITPKNLAWGTRKENMADKKIHGTEMGTKNLIKANAAKAKLKALEDKVALLLQIIEMQDATLAKIVSVGYTGAEYVASEARTKVAEMLKEEKK